MFLKWRRNIFFAIGNSGAPSAELSQQNHKLTPWKGHHRNLPLMSRIATFCYDFFVYNMLLCVISNNWLFLKQLKMLEINYNTQFSALDCKTRLHFSMLRFNSTNILPFVPNTNQMCVCVATHRVAHKFLFGFAVRICFEDQRNYYSVVDHNNLYNVYKIM